MAPLASFERGRAFDLLNLQIFTAKSSGKRYSTEVFFKRLSDYTANNLQTSINPELLTLIVTGTRKFDHIIPVLKENGCNSQMFA